LIDYVCDSIEIMGKAAIDRLILAIPEEYIENPVLLIEEQLQGEPLINPKIYINELEPQIPGMITSTIPIEAIQKIIQK